MDLGRVIADGPPDEVLTDNAVVESYIGVSGYQDIVGSLGARTSGKATGAKFSLVMEALVDLFRCWIDIVLLRR